MNISYEEIGCLRVTFPAGGCAAGKVCKVNGGGQAAPCSAKERFCGLVESVHGSQAAVLLHGFAALPYSGAAPALGYVALSADGAGGVQVDTAGASYLAVAVDTAAKTVTVEL